MRYHTDDSWAFLRVSTATAFQAASYASLPGVPKQQAYKYFCYARAQLGYCVGETTGALAPLSLALHRVCELLLLETYTGCIVMPK